MKNMIRPRSKFWKSIPSMASTATIFLPLDSPYTLVGFNSSSKCQWKCRFHFSWPPSSSTNSSFYRLKMVGKHQIRRNASLQCNSRLPTTIQCAAQKGGVTTTQEKKDYEFFDDAAEVELRLPLQEESIPTAKEVFVDVQDTSLVVAVQIHNEVKVLLSIDRLYGQIKPAETVWYLDEDELVVNLKKNDVEVKWPDIMEAWNSLTIGVPALLKGTSVYVVGDSTEINWAVAKELAMGLKYTPLQTSQLLEQVTKKSLHNLLTDEGENSVAEAEAELLGSINTHIRLVVATLGGLEGAASRPERWSRLHAGFTVWLSQSQAKGENIIYLLLLPELKPLSASKGYAKADVVVMLGGWDADSARPAAEGCLRALKYLIESEKELPGKKSLYIRMGCRGDWPNLMPPGWNPFQKDAETATPARA